MVKDQGLMVRLGKHSLFAAVLTCLNKSRDAHNMETRTNLSPYKNRKGWSSNRKVVAMT